MKKVKLKINTFEVLSRAVEDGISYGYHRAYKHNDNPDEEAFRDAIENAVMNSLCEVINFDFE